MSRIEGFRGLFLSSVSGGPMGWLVERLRSQGASVRSFSQFSAERWRKSMRGGRFISSVARLESYLVYPLRSVFAAVGMSLGGGRRFDKGIVIASTNPFFLPHLMVLTRCLHRCGVIALMYDVYPDAIEASRGKVGGVFTEIGSRMNRWLFKQADGVVFLGEAQAKSACERYGAKDYRIIATGASMRDFFSSEDSGNRLGEELEGKVVYSYVGNMGLMHDWESFRDGIGRFLDGLDEVQRKGVMFLIAASGPGERSLRESWGHRYEDCVKFMGPLEDNLWSEVMLRSDVSLVSLKDSARSTCVPSKSYSALASGSALLAVSGEGSDLRALVEDYGCGVCLDSGDISGMVEALENFRNGGRNQYLEGIRRAAELHEVGALSELWLDLISEIKGGVGRRWSDIGYDVVKRIFDVICSGGGLVVLSPLMGVVALLVRMQMGSPVIFSQDRPGLHGKCFKLRKFRSMRVAKEGEGAESDGERLTGLGKFLRKTSLDELATLWNVFVGDMSLVGPRPLLKQYLGRYSAEQAERMLAKPGVSGWAQVHGRNALSWEEKFRLDRWYVYHASFWLDLEILWRSVGVVFGRRGISHQGEVTMPEFMGNGDSVQM